jgi:hypothetical protein
MAIARNPLIGRIVAFSRRVESCGARGGAAMMEHGRDLKARGKAQALQAGLLDDLPALPGGDDPGPLALPMSALRLARQLLLLS